MKLQITTPVPCLPSSRVLKILVAAAGLIFFLSCSVRGIMSLAGIWINVSNSLPATLYQSYDGAGDLQRGDLVLSCLPDSYASFAHERGYLTGGNCRGGTAPVGKHVVALPGDHVIIDERGIMVNGRLIADSKPAVKDGMGRELVPARLNRVLKSGELILSNPGAISYDSRYFGAVASNLVISKIRPLTVFAGNNKSSGVSQDIA